MFFVPAVGIIAVIAVAVSAGDGDYNVGSQDTAPSAITVEPGECPVVFLKTIRSHGALIIQGNLRNPF